jgi:hypothetical protein
MMRRRLMHVKTSHSRTTHRKTARANYPAAVATILCAALLALLLPVAHADTRYYQHTFFDNSSTSISGDAYYYSSGTPSAPSILELVNRKLPVETKIFLTPPNALRLAWQSMPEGGWDAEIGVMNFRNRQIRFAGDTLFFWVYAPEAIAAKDLPLLRLEDVARNFSAPLAWGEYSGDLPAARWVQVKIPLAKFVTASLHEFTAQRLRVMVFSQGLADSAKHTLLLDEIRIDSAANAATTNPSSTGIPARVPCPAAPGSTGIPACAPCPNASPAASAHANSPRSSDISNLRAPHHLTATAFERHIALHWDAPVGAAADNVERYIIFRAPASAATPAAQFQPIGMQVRGVTRFTDYLGLGGQVMQYRVVAQDAHYRESPPSNSVSAATRTEDHLFSDEELLTMLQEETFRYYWEGAHPDSGTSLENIPGDDRIVATGASGFGIMAIIVGVERGFITREQGLARLEKIVNFLERAPRFHGVWAHFMDGHTAKVIPLFDMVDDAGDLVETAFLMEGLLAARQYFRADAARGERLFARISKLWEGVEWDWYSKNRDGRALYWHWSPDFSWHISNRLTGFNEAMIVYLLAMASPTHPISPDLYYTGWANQVHAAIGSRADDPAPGDRYTNGREYFGIKLDVGWERLQPLFFQHYSFMGFDPHAGTDRFTNYFENNRNVARINRAYCIADPKHFKGYSADSWGLTAADGPEGYIPSAPNDNDDQGVMAPTGALASYPYTPEASLAALKHFYREDGAWLWDIYGPRDAFDAQENWVSPIYMGLNQAPITVMIENYRSGLVWKMFMQNPEIEPMLEKAGLRMHSNEAAK